jgi:hypothetical protein
MITLFGNKIRETINSFRSHRIESIDKIHKKRYADYHEEVQIKVGNIAVRKPFNFALPILETAIFIVIYLFVLFPIFRIIFPTIEHKGMVVGLLVIPFITILTHFFGDFTTFIFQKIDLHKLDPFFGRKLSETIRSLFRKNK